jgi:hypothetical protein
MKKIGLRKSRSLGFCGKRSGVSRSAAGFAGRMGCGSSPFIAGVRLIFYSQRPPAGAKELKIRNRKAVFKKCGATKMWHYV